MFKQRFSRKANRAQPQALTHLRHPLRDVACWQMRQAGTPIVCTQLMQQHSGMHVCTTDIWNTSARARMHCKVTASAATPRLMIPCH
jgi:hypothetical protein